MKSSLSCELRALLVHSITFVAPPRSRDS